MFSFIADVESPDHKPHTVKCEGYWAESDGDHIRPGFRFFYPETVWLLQANRRRLLPEVADWLWETLSYQGEDAYRIEREDADAEKVDLLEDWLDDV